MWTGAHTCGGFNSVGQPPRTGIVLVGHINKSCPHPSSSDVTTIVGFHLAVYLQWSSVSADPVVPRWSSGVAVMYLLAGGGRVHFSITRAGQVQLSPHLLQNVFPQLLSHSIRYILYQVYQDVHLTHFCHLAMVDHWCLLSICSIHSRYSLWANWSYNAINYIPLVLDHSCVLAFRHFLLVLHGCPSCPGCPSLPSLPGGPGTDDVVVAGHVIVSAASVLRYIAVKQVRATRSLIVRQSIFSYISCLFLNDSWDSFSSGQVSTSSVNLLYWNSVAEPTFISNCIPWSVHVGGSKESSVCYDSYHSGDILVITWWYLIHPVMSSKSITDMGPTH